MSINEWKGNEWLIEILDVKFCLYKSLKVLNKAQGQYLMSEYVDGFVKQQ